MLVGRDLIFVWALVVESYKYYFNIYFDCEAAYVVIVLGGMIPFQVNA